jgi:hypothetical protein
MIYEFAVGLIPGSVGWLRALVLTGILACVFAVGRHSDTEQYNGGPLDARTDLGRF